ncbi:hypothetical protein HK101_001520, partial [Irineochytrium annulatum]
MVPAIDAPTPEGWNREPEVTAEKKPDAETEKTVEDLLALAKDGVFPKEAELLYRLPAYRNAWRKHVFSLAASGVIEYVVRTGGLSLMERDSENATILTVAATHERRELCDYLLGTSDGRALFFDLANSEDTRHEDERRKLSVEDKRKSKEEESTDAGEEDTAFEPELPVERLMRMDNTVLLEVFLDNIRRYSMSVKEGTDSSDEYNRITLINERHARLMSKLQSTIYFMTVVNFLTLGQVRSDMLGDDLNDRPWNEVKREILAFTALFFARSAEHRRVLEWILDDYGECFEVGILSAVMEAVVLGYRGVETVEELMDQQVTEGEDGKAAYFEAAYGERWKDHKGLADGWRSNRKAALLSDEGWEERLDMIKMVMRRIDDGEGGRVPTFHLLVVAGEVNILQWLRAENHLDLSTQLYMVQDIAEKTAELSL